MRLVKTHHLLLVALAISLFACTTPKAKTSIETDENGFAVLSDEQVENLVKRSYQYVAMFNVNNKFAFDEEGMSTKGYNKGFKNTQLLDHTAQFIARPNNDVLYQIAMLDLRKDAAVFELPPMESKYVSLMATAYDHYVNVPLSTTSGDFNEATTVLFYTPHTENYKGEAVDGVDHIFEMTGDFISLVLRIMPHANEPEKYEHIIGRINSLTGTSLSEYQGKPRLEEDDIKHPSFGRTDDDIYGNNLLEVMQFVFNHTSFDESIELDREILAAYKPLGIEPGKVFESESAVKIEGKRFREVSLEVKEEALATMIDPDLIQQLIPNLFQLKDKMTLETELLQSVVGPIGLPIKEAMYPPVVTSDGAPMNAANDYIIRMDSKDLPPSNAFWSLTLYDTDNGFFIPNDSKKYSVGENSGMKLNEEGGIEIYVSTEQPAGVPAENWLPINRLDQGIDIILRIYAPDMERIASWKAPVAEKI